MELLMEQLLAALRITLANSFELYFKAHGHHWNVEGIEFSQLHEFFGDLYQEVFNSIDPLAEEIRKLDATVPYGVVAFSKFKTVEDSEIYGKNVKGMLEDLQTTNQSVLESLNTSFKLAEEQNLQGLMDFLAGRISEHEKHAWMLRASLK
jgi:starvation-inducible DNA-binding protein